MALPSLVIVRHDYGGDGHTTHVPIRTAGTPCNGPAVWITACGRFAHVSVPAPSGAAATCTTCQDRTVPVPTLPRCWCGRPTPYTSAYCAEHD